ncbi:right-handed parallel beta-helix repeat-containing protein [Candidatus Thorarchaeota archaeon]|nr:MAG: right-handed parallel beta-helix repeat-containing protein [Candidatus Thorarchaeota archaeon]
MRKSLFVGIVVTILFCSIGSSKVLVSDEVKLDSTANLSQTYTPHAPMVINSNDDFATEGWSGDGSPGNPYVIEWLEFTSDIDGACISISDTTVWFRIINCFFSPTAVASAVTLQSVSNGQIQYSITGENAWGILVIQSSEIQLEHLTLFGTCIIMEQSWMCSVSFCTIYGAPGDGVFFNDCSQMTVDGCYILSCTACGISLHNTGETSLFDNTILMNDLEQIYIDGDSSSNYIYNNEIHVGSFGVQDDGSSNYWDNGVSIGNGWSDYNGSGFYYIPGSAGSIDHYPREASSITAPTIATTTTTITTTTTTTTNSPDSGEILISNWTPMDISVRVMLGLFIGVSYSALVIITIKRFR